MTVWRIRLDPSRAPGAEALAELSDAERARAALFVSDALRNRWLTAHVAMRRVLAGELGVRPEAIAYGAGAAGKPFIASPVGSGVEYSNSDSGDLALVAVTRDGAIGVDVEQCRPKPRLGAIARAHFADEECAALDALPEAERVGAFYRTWSRKEAFIKALGVGLKYGLARFAVTHDSVDVRVTRVDEVGDARERWDLRAIPVDRGYEAALAAPWPIGELTVRDYPASQDSPVS